MGKVRLTWRNARVSQYRADYRRPEVRRRKASQCPIQISNRGAPRGKVAVQVRAAEPVDGLLRVADQDSSAVKPNEGLPQDVPLVGVGVLELVDQHDREPLPQAGAHLGAELRVGQRGPEPGDDVAGAV